MIINGLSWRVRFVSPTHPMLLTPSHTYALGVCDKPTQTIYINETIPNWKVRKVIIHELTHAFVFSYGESFSYEDEERVADFVSNYAQNIVSKSKKIYNKKRGLYKT